MIGLTVRIGRLERCLEYELRHAMHHATGLARLRHQLHVDRLTAAITRLRGLAEDAEDLHELRDLPTQSRAPRSVEVKPAQRPPTVPPQQTPPSRLSSVGIFTLSAPAPRARSMRDDELEFETVWTPHRDAASLIGDYERRTRG